MRSERFKVISDMIANGSFAVLDYQRQDKNTELVTAKTSKAILLQLTIEELADAVSGYMGSNRQAAVTSVVQLANGECQVHMKVVTVHV